MIGLKNIFKNIKVITLLSFLLISLYLIASLMFFGGVRGVIVTKIGLNSKCANVRVGSSITQMEGTRINNVQDFNLLISNLKAGQYISMIVDNGPANCVVVNDGNIGIGVKNALAKSLKFGIDLIGGSVYTFVPNETANENNLSKIVGIIEKRINFFGFRQTKVYRDGEFIKIKSSRDADLNSLVMAGKIETKIIQEIEIKNETGKMKIGSEAFPIVFKEDKISVNDRNYSLKEKFEISNISFSATNFTKNSALVEIDVFSNEDINVSQILQGAVEKIGDNYRYAVPIELNTITSFKFSQITRGLSVSRQIGKESVLNGQIVFLIDGEPITFPLDIPLDLAGKSVNVIIGFEKTEKDAYTKMDILKSILSFGRLPNTLILRTEEPFKASIGSVELGSVSAIVIFVSSALIVMGRFRHKNLLMGKAVLLAGAGMFCTLGFIALLQKYSSYNLVIDFLMLVGLSVSFVFTLIKFFILAEEKHKGTHFHIKYGYKKIMSFNNFLNIFLIVISIATYSLGMGDAGFIIIVYLFIEVLLLRMIYTDSLKKSLS